MVSRLLRVTYNRWWVISCSHSLLPPCSLPNPSFPSPARAKESIKRSRLYISQKQTHFFHLWFGPKRIGNFNFDCAAMIVRCADDDGGGAWVAEQKVLIMSFRSPHFPTLSLSIIIIAFIFTSNVQLNLWSRQQSEISWNSFSNSLCSKESFIAKDASVKISRRLQIAFFSDSFNIFSPCSASERDATREDDGMNFSSSPIPHSPSLVPTHFS